MASDSAQWRPPTPLSPATWRTGGLGNFVCIYPLLVLCPVAYLSLPLLECAWPTQLLAISLAAAACYEGCRMIPPEAAPIGRGYLGVMLPLCIASLGTALLLPSKASILPAVVIAFLLMLIKAGVCMSMCYHRYAAHAAFKCAWPTNLALGVLGCLAFQGGPLWWASKHRAHHKFCDTDSRDPHSPLLIGKTNAFIFFLTGATPRDRWRMQAVYEEFVPTHCDTRGMRLVDSFSWLPPLLEFCIALWAFGAPGLYACFSSSWLCQAVTMWFNVRNHLPHAHEQPVSCTAQNAVVPGGGADCLYFFLLGKISAIATPLIGEAGHKHHHEHPALARRPGGVIDVPYAVCAALAAVGLVWSVKLA